MAKTNQKLTKAEEEKLVDGNINHLQRAHLPNLLRGGVQEYEGEEIINTNLPELPPGMGNWNEHQPDFLTTFVFEEIGDFILGVYVEKRIDVGKHKSNIYVFQVGTGVDIKNFAIWGKSSLDLKLKKIVTGTVVYIDLIGKHESKQGDDWFDLRVLTPKK